MNEKEIRTRHDQMESMKSTQSVKIVNELKSQAHKDRGELLKIIQELREKNGVLLTMIHDEKLRADGLQDYVDMEISEQDILVP